VCSSDLRRDYMGGTPYGDLPTYLITGYAQVIHQNSRLVRIIYIM
jgi:hypothetical protein